MRYTVIVVLARCLMRVLFLIRMKGRENIPHRGALLVAANHISYLDPVAVGASVPRSLYYMARDELFAIPFLGKLIHYCQAFPVRRSNPGPEALRKALRVLKAGKALLVFPEGTRSLTGKLGEAQPGVGFLACKSGATIVPALVIGTNKTLPPGAKWIRLHRIEVRFGRPIRPEQLDLTGTEHEIYHRLSEYVLHCIKQLMK